MPIQHGYWSIKIPTKKATRIKRMRLLRNKFNGYPVMLFPPCLPRTTGMILTTPPIPRSKNDPNTNKDPRRLYSGLNTRSSDPEPGSNPNFNSRKRLIQGRASRKPIIAEYLGFARMAFMSCLCRELNTNDSYLTGKPIPMPCVLAFKRLLCCNQLIYRSLDQLDQDRLVDIR